MYIRTGDVTRPAVRVKAPALWQSLAAPRHAQPHRVLAVTALLAIVYAGLLLARHTAPMQRLIRLRGNWIAAVVPRSLGALTFIAGALLLFSGATPAAAVRLHWVNELVPLPVVELSHFFDNMAGVLLLILARGVERRLDVAYHLTVAMLVAAIFLSILRALDVEQAGVLTLVLALFIPNRRYFYRKSSLIEERFTAPWIAAIILVVVGSIGLGMVSYEKVQLSRHAFFHFGRHAQEARFLRATAGVVATLVFLAFLRLFRPARPLIPDPTAADIAAARAISARTTEAATQLAFLGDKHLLFDRDRTGFVMYGVNGRSWVALGDPIGPVSVVPSLIADFARLADRNGGWPVFYKVAPTLLYLYLDHGLSVVKLGEEARVPLAEFSLEGPARRNLRRVWRRMVDDGCTFEMHSGAGVAALLPELRTVSDAWLAQKRAREKGFSLGFFDERYVRDTPVGVVRRNGRIIGFANLWVSGGQEEVEADLTRYTPDAPPGLMRYLYTEMMLRAKQDGFRWFNLGMAPLSGLTIHPRAPIWNQLAVAVRGYGERFYNFQGIREFKEWFHPEWEPRFLVSPGGAARPVILANIAALIGGGLDGVLRR